MPLRVLLVEDHAPLRSRLRALLTSEIGAEGVVEAGSGREALDALGTMDLTLVLLDLKLPDWSGLDLLAEILRLRPRLPVIVVSALPEIPYRPAALDLGAIAFVKKGELPAALITAVRMAGDVFGLGRHDGEER